MWFRKKQPVIDAAYIIVPEFQHDSINPVREERSAELVDLLKDGYKVVSSICVLEYSVHYVLVRER